ncbi:acyltransferase [Jiella sp. CQZ9-1]|uniref:Acyltransferase n=2 Tax=Jiella flava TaxID=2816857 RepID=A0A939FYS5_9HYPH|nr:acyltransferase [Jiella flava]
MAYHFVFWAPYGVETGAGILHRLLPLLDMFFMISGFFITTRYRERVTDLRSYGAFMRGRAARLLPLHYMTTGFFVLVALAAWSVGAKNYPWLHDFQALPYHLLLLHGLGLTDGLALNYPSWSISAEFFSYALFPLILLTLRLGGLRGLLVGIAIWITLLEVASAYGWFPSGHWMTADAMGAYRALADFMIGAAASIVVERRFVDLRRHWPGLVLTALAVGAMLVGFQYYVVMPLMILSLVLTALAETANPQSTARLAPLMPVTRVAFGIYLIHPVMEVLFLEGLWYHWLKNTGVVPFYLFWLLPMMATVAVALLSARYVEPLCAKWIQPRKPARASVHPGLISV